MSLGWNPCLSPQAILSPPIIDRCSFSLVQLLNPRSYTCPFHQYCNVFPYAQRNNHIVVLTPRCQGLFQTFLASSGSEYPVAFRTSWSQVSRWCVEIVILSCFLAKCLNWGLRVHIAAAFSCQDHCLSSSRWWCTRHQWSSLGWFRRWPSLEVWVLFVELPFHYHADIQYTVIYSMYIYIYTFTDKAMK